MTSGTLSTRPGSSPNAVMAFRPSPDGSVETLCAVLPSGQVAMFPPWCESIRCLFVGRGPEDGVSIGRGHGSRAVATPGRASIPSFVGTSERLADQGFGTDAR